MGCIECTYSNDNNKRETPNAFIDKKKMFVQNVIINPFGFLQIHFFLRLVYLFFAFLIISKRQYNNNNI